MSPCSARAAWARCIARDAQLQRDVALKVLPDHFAADTDRLARFQREAQVLASLAHSNIGHIYGMEQGPAEAGPQARVLVLELIEGPTLADRIAQGPMPIEEALPIARQIADALDAAHQHGIVHRDLKPANVKVREDGTVKVLDFGLAKLGADTADAPSFAGGTLSPTLSAAFTGAGVILGTAAYMSPEQARGKPVDKRADIWAFGCVLFEMLTGRRAFDGTDATEMIAAVVRGEPEWSALPAAAPLRLRALLTRCLEKDPKRRLRDIGDVRFELDHVLDAAEPQRVPAAVVRSPLWRRLLPYAVTTTAAAALAGVAVGMIRPEPSRALAQFAVPLPAGQNFSYAGRHLLAISPASTHLVYAANTQLYLRAIDQLEAVPIRSTNPGGRSPFFSPDGQWIGFWQDGQLKKVSVSGGAPVVLCAAENPWGASWGADNTILFGQGPAGISRVSGNGGTAETLITIDAGRSAHGPQMLPDERTVLFTLTAQAVGAWNEASIVAHSLETGARKVLIEGGTDARYVPTGHIVYSLEGALLAVPFDADALEITGGPVPVVDQVAQSDSGLTGAAHFSISHDGTLVYVADSLAAGTFFRRTLAWVDRQGREELLKAPLRAYRYARLSPDGQRAALDIQDENRDVWVWHLTGETLTRLTLEAVTEQYGVWTPDGERVIFTSARAGAPNLFWQRADGTGMAEQLTKSPNQQFPQTVSPDGGQLVFREVTAGGSSDIKVLPLQGDRKPQPIVVTPFNELNAELTADGRWLAYQSNESGRDEIYVRPFPNVGEGRWQVSTDGGNRPLWARSGRELFYIAANGSLMSVPVTTVGGFRAVTPVKLFDLAVGVTDFGVGRMYDVAPDGGRFLVIKPGLRTEDGSEGVSITLVQNWFEELKRRVPSR